LSPGRARSAQGDGVKKLNHHPSVASFFATSGGGWEKSARGGRNCSPRPEPFLRKARTGPCPQSGDNGFPRIKPLPPSAEAPLRGKAKVGERASTRMLVWWSVRRQAFLRRRAANPRPPTAASNIGRAAGSGTGAVDPMTAVKVPDTSASSKIRVPALVSIDPCVGLVSHR
jgi:hypothetical protein